jgi:hypothetical protein
VTSGPLAATTSVSVAAGTIGWIVGIGEPAAVVVDAGAGVEAGAVGVVVDGRITGGWPVLRTW